MPACELGGQVSNDSDTATAGDASQEATIALQFLVGERNDGGPEHAASRAGSLVKVNPVSLKNPEEFAFYLQKQQPQAAQIIEIS